MYGLVFSAVIFLTTAVGYAEERRGIFLDVSSSREADITGYKRNALTAVEAVQSREVKWMYTEAGLEMTSDGITAADLRNQILRAEKKDRAPLEASLWALGKSVSGGEQAGRIHIQTDFYGGPGSQEMETLRILHRLGVSFFALVKPRWEKDLGNARRLMSANGGLMLEYNDADELAQVGALMAAAWASTAEIGRTTAVDSGEYVFDVDQSVNSLDLILVGKGIESLTVTSPDGTPHRIGGRTKTATGLKLDNPMKGKWQAKFVGWGELEFVAFAQGPERIVVKAQRETLTFSSWNVPNPQNISVKLHAYELNRPVTSPPTEMPVSTAYIDSQTSITADLSAFPRGEYAIVLSIKADDYQREIRRYYSNTALPPVVFGLNPIPNSIQRQNTDDVHFSFCMLRDGSHAVKPVVRVEGAAVDIAKQSEKEVAAVAEEKWEGKAGLLEGIYDVQLQTRSDFGEVPLRSWSFTLDQEAAQKILISEIHPQGKEGFWIELEGLISNQDISGYVAGNFSGSLKSENRMAAEPVTLKKGDRVIVRWDERGEDETDLRGDLNKNGVREIYVQTFAAPGPDAGAVVLREGEAILDAVVYRKGTADVSAREESEFAGLRQYKEWAGPAVQTGEDNQSIGRTGQKDTNKADDFKVFATPSPGSANVDQGNIPKKGDVLINEVYMGSDERWAEIKAVRGRVDISFLKLSNLEGQEEVLARASVNLDAGEFAVVHWDKTGTDETDEAGDVNKNGLRDLYVSDPPPFSTDDQLALMYVDQILDAVVFTNADGEMALPQIKDAQTLLGLEEWHGDMDRKNQQGAVQMPKDKGTSIGRMSEEDGNTKEDWAQINAPTPGKENSVKLFRRMPFEVKIIAVQPKNDPWAYTVLYVDTGEGDVSNVMLTDLDGEDRPLAADRAWVKAGEKIWVTWGAGTNETDKAGDINKNGRRDFYIEDAQAPSATDDQLVLMLEDRFMDAVCWANGDNKVAAQELKDFSDVIAKGAWNGRFTTGAEDGAVIYSGSELRRKTTENRYIDTERNGDWE